MLKPETLALLMNGLSIGAYILASLTILATVVVRFVGRSNAPGVESIGDGVFKAIKYLPTIGVNPNTAALEAAYIDAKAQLDAQPVVSAPAAASTPAAVPAAKTAA